MKMAWGGLLIGMECTTGGGNELRIFFAAGGLQGKFDTSGEVCFDLADVRGNRTFRRRFPGNGCPPAG